jgi:hypothetical protein
MPGSPMSFPRRGVAEKQELAMERHEACFLFKNISHTLLVVNGQTRALTVLSYRCSIVLSMPSSYLSSCLRRWQHICPYKYLITAPILTQRSGSSSQATGTSARTAYTARSEGRCSGVGQGIGCRLLVQARSPTTRGPIIWNCDIDCRSSKSPLPHPCPYSSAMSAVTCPCASGLRVCEATPLLTLSRPPFRCIV